LLIHRAITAFHNPILDCNSFQTSCPNVTRLALPTACDSISFLSCRHSRRHILDANNEVYTIYLSNNRSLELPAFISLSPASHLLLYLPFHRIQSIRGLTHQVSATSKEPKQLIGMARVFVCVKDDEHGFQLEPEGLESWNTVQYLHFRNFNPNYYRWQSLMYEL
jgi:hypothetical protein